MPDDPNTGSVYGTPMPWAEEPTMSDRDCVHGSLARSCQVCELEAEVDRLRARIAQLEHADSLDVFTEDGA